MNEVIFNEYDYDNRIVKQYRRTGICNHCGACCTRTIYVGIENKYVLPKAYTHNRWVKTEDERLPNMLMQFHTTDVEQKPCQLLININGGKICSAHNANKFDACTIFPMLPEHIQSLPECSYTFELIGEYSFEEIGHE